MIQIKLRIHLRPVAPTLNGHCTEKIKPYRKKKLYNLLMKYRIMRFIFVLAIILNFSLLAELNAQELKNNLQLQIGIGHISRQDNVFSPFIHQDISPINLGVRYQREDKFYQNVNIRFALLYPYHTDAYQFFDNNEIKTTSPHGFTIVDLDYWIGKAIKETDNNSTKIGFSVNADVQALNYVYGRISSFGYYSSFGIGGFVYHNHKFNEKNHLSGYISLPVISWLARSPYLVNDDEFIENTSSHSGVKTFFAFIGDGKIATFNQLNIVDISATYTFVISSRWGLGFGYLFEFIHSNRPRNLLSYRNSIFLNTSFQF